MWSDHDVMLRALMRARVTSVDDSGGQQLVALRGLPRVQPTDVYRPQPHGFSSHPPVGAEGVILPLGSHLDRLLFLGGEVPSLRPTALGAGHAAIYDQSGNILKIVPGQGATLSHAQKITVQVGSATVTITPTMITLQVGTDGVPVAVQNKRIDLGQIGAPNKVMTDAGPSNTVYAKI